MKHSRLFRLPSSASAQSATSFSFFQFLPVSVLFQTLGFYHQTSGLLPPPWIVAFQIEFFVTRILKLKRVKKLYCGSILSLFFFCFLFLPAALFLRIVFLCYPATNNCFLSCVVCPMLPYPLSGLLLLSLPKSCLSHASSVYNLPHRNVCSLKSPSS